MAQELADLREIVFNQQRSVPQEKEEPAKIAFPYRTDRRVIAFGGHDSWLREIKFKVPDVRFMGEDISSAEVIRRADVVWIQTNCIGHNTYYNVIDLVRRYGRKVRYFKYASAVKCAEQVAEEEKKNKEIESCPAWWLRWGGGAERKGFEVVEDRPCPPPSFAAWPPVR